MTKEERKIKRKAYLVLAPYYLKYGVEMTNYAIYQILSINGYNPNDNLTYDMITLLKKELHIYFK